MPTNAALKVARVVVKAELKLVGKAVKDEIAILTEQLDAVLKREQQLMKLNECKVKQMLAAGASWENKQLVKNYIDINQNAA